MKINQKVNINDLFLQRFFTFIIIKDQDKTHEKC